MCLWFSLSLNYTKWTLFFLFFLDVQQLLTYIDLGKFMLESQFHYPSLQIVIIHLPCTVFFRNMCEGLLVRLWFICSKVICFPFLSSIISVGIINIKLPICFSDSFPK